jgi:hypothetical protein
MLEPTVVSAVRHSPLCLRIIHMPSSTTTHNRPYLHCNVDGACTFSACSTLLTYAGCRLTCASGSLPLVLSQAPADGAAAAVPVVDKANFREGDWLCPNPECKNHNFASRVVCRRCPTLRPGVDPQQAAQMQNYGGNARPANATPMRPGDWVCPDPSCANLNFASRAVCRMCPTRKHCPHPALPPPRTALPSILVLPSPPVSAAAAAVLAAFLLAAAAFLPRCTVGV